MNSALLRWIRLRSLRAPGAGIGFRVLGDELDLAADNAAAFVDNVDGGLGRLVVPKAPGRDDAGKVAVVTDHDRARGLREQVLGDGEAGGAGQRAAPSAVARKLRRDCFLRHLWSSPGVRVD